MRLTGFAVALVLFVFRNRWLFSVPVSEGGDSAANSIRVLDARHFEQLVGNYSRLGFSHPGPAYLYVQASGEWLWHDVLGIAPSPWNGQVLALLVLNAALFAFVLGILAAWFGRWPAVTAGAAVLGYFAVHGELATGNWMPLLYFPPFLLLLTAAASVAAGRATGRQRTKRSGVLRLSGRNERHCDLWALALAGGLLVHGHAEFLFLVPAIAGPAVAVLVLRRREAAARRGPWLAALGVVAVFALPVVVNQVLHWPGEFGKYLSYGSSSRAGGHPPWAALGYALRFWPGGHPVVRPLVAVALFAAPLLLARLLSDDEVRRFVRTGVAVAGLGTALFVLYAAVGIDDLSQEYVGFFAHAMPVLLLALTAAALLALTAVALPVRPAAALAGAALAVALVAALLAPSLVTSRSDDLPGLPRIRALLAGRAGGRPVVLELDDNERWPVLTGLLLAGRRSGERICAADRSWAYMVTDRLVCTPDEDRTGVHVRLGVPGAATDGTVVGDLGNAAVVSRG